MSGFDPKPPHRGNTARENLAIVVMIITAIFVVIWTTPDTHKVFWPDRDMWGRSTITVPFK